MFALSRYTVENALPRKPKPDREILVVTGNESTKLIPASVRTGGWVANRDYLFHQVYEYFFR